MTNDGGDQRGISLRAFIPNAVTVLALCVGLTGIRYAFAQDWEKAMIAILVAGILDGLDGRIARMLKANSRFGAELDSLCDNIGFGTAPALILFQFSLSDAPRFGWTVALALAVACALRLARFNARIDADFQPHKAAGFNTGVPAPAGAGLAFAPVYLWLLTGDAMFTDWRLVMPWTLFVAVLMISAIPTFSWTSIRDSPKLAGGRPGRSCRARRGADQRTLADLAGDVLRLSGECAVQPAGLCQGQAAARSRGVARMTLCGRAAERSG